jgi:omega-amidase
MELMKSYPENNSLLIFPEMTLTGFTMHASKFGESFSEASFGFFSGIAQKNKIFIAAGIIEKEDEQYFNSLIILNPKGNLISKYRKVHPFSYSTEDKNYKRGEKVITSQINELKVGLSVCYDLRFPELYRYYAKERVDLIIVIANWPDTRIEHWQTLLKARAIENQCYVAGVNRVGDDPLLHYTGCSSIFDPMGKEIISLKDEEIITFAEINKEQVDRTRNKLPFLNDMHLI